MTTITIILFIISFALLNFSLISIFYHNKFTNDTTYFILSNSIILVSILLFYYYFNDYYLSLISENNGNFYVGLYDSNYNDVIDEKFCDANEVIRLYNEYNPRVISNDFNVVGVIKVNKVNLDFVKIINYYMDKEKVSAYAIVPNYLKLPQVLESK